MKKNQPFALLDKIFLSSASLLALCFSAEQVNAASLQSFGPYTYVNPASLSQVQNLSLSLGGSETFLRSKFTGTQTGVTGKSAVTQPTFLPYGQAAYRINSDWVIGADISNPGVLNAYHFKSGPIAGTKTLGFTKNYSGKVSYQFNDQIAVGLGVDFLHFYGYKYGIRTGAGLVTTKARGIAPGWDAGILYKILPTTSIYLGFTSKITKKAKGTSYLNGASTSMRVIAPLPNTYTLNLIHNFTPEWRVNLIGRYIEWSTYQYFVLTKVPQPVGRIVSPKHFKNAWEVSGALRYQFASQWAGAMYLEYDSNPQPLAFRGINFPTDQLVKIGCVGPVFTDKGNSGRVLLCSKCSQHKI